MNDLIVLLQEGTPPLWTILSGQAAIMVLIVVCFSLSMYRLRVYHCAVLQHTVDLVVDNHEVNTLLASSLARENSGKLDTLATSVKCVQQNVVDEGAKLDVLVAAKLDTLATLKRVQQKVVDEGAKLDVLVAASAKATR